MAVEEVYIFFRGVINKVDSCEKTVVRGENKGNLIEAFTILLRGLPG